MATFSLMNQSFLFSALTYVWCFNLQTKCLQLAGFLSSWPKFMETLEIVSALSQNVLHSLHFVFWYLTIVRSVLYYTVLLPFFMSCSCDSPGRVGATWSSSIWHGTKQAQCHAPSGAECIFCVNVLIDYKVSSDFSFRREKDAQRQLLYNI